MKKSMLKIISFLYQGKADQIRFYVGYLVFKARDKAAENADVILLALSLTEAHTDFIRDDSSHILM